MANIGEGAAWRVQQNKLETYLVGTVTDAPPSSATEEAGVTVGQPEQIAGIGQGELTLTGTGYRETNTPTIRLEVTDHAHLAVGMARELLLPPSESRHETLAGRDTISGSRALVKVPRIALTRTNNDVTGTDLVPVGISEDFALFTYLESFALNVEFDTSVTVELPDGSWLLFAHARDLAHSNAPVLIVYRLAQWEAPNWVRIYGPSTIPLAAGMDAVIVDRSVYFYVSTNELETGASVISGRLYVYRFTGTTDSVGTDPSALNVVAGPILLSSITNVGTLAYNMAACSLRSGVFVAVNNNIDTRSTVAFGYSADQRNWGGPDERHGHFVSIGDFASVFFDPTTVGDDAIAGETVTDLKMATADIGWFCTDAGRIFATADSGKTWAPQTSPISPTVFAGIGAAPVSLHALAVLDSLTVLAFGHAGAILQTIDGGSTWLVLRYRGIGIDAIPDEQWVVGAKGARDAITATPVDLLCAEWMNSAIVVCGGEDGYLFRSIDAGMTWTLLLHNGPGAYRGLTHLSTTLYVCGDWDANKRASARTWFASIANITTTPSAPSYDGPASRGRTSMVAMTVGADGPDYLYAVERDGRVYRFGNSEPWHRICRVPSFCTGIFRLPTDATQLFVVTPDGVWRTTEATSTSQPQFFPQHTLTQDNQVGYWFDADNGIIAGRGVQRTTIAYDVRFGAALVPMDDGNSVIFACNNLTQQLMEIWLISDVTGSPTMTLVDGRNVYDSALKPGGTYLADYGFPAATRAASGEIIVTAGVGVFAPMVTTGAAGTGNGIKQYAISYRNATTMEETGRSMAASITLTNRQASVSFVAAPAGYTTEIYRADGYGHPFYWIASIAATTAIYTDTFSAAPNLNRSAPHQSGARVNPDGTGRTWVWPDDPSLPIPVGALGATPSLNGADEARTIMGVRGGRLVSTITTPNWIFTLIARSWQPPTDATGRTHYAPISPGVEQWLLDDLFVLVASPQPGDVFTIAPRYTYGRARIADESPSIDWRTANNNNQVVITWDRTDPDIVAVLGPGDLWEASAFALIGTNFRAVEFRVSIGSASIESGYSTSDILNCDVDTGVISAMVGKNILGDATKHWIPDQWAPATQQFYALVSGTLPPAVYRILGNSENSLTLERSSGETSTLSGFYSIFTDRFFWNGSTATHGTAPTWSFTAGALASTIYRFGRYVQIVIPGLPAQPTADGYRRIGTAIIGAATSTEVPATAEDDRGRGYAWDSRWRPITNTEEQTAQTGISRVRHFGRTGQLWTLPYEAVEGWRRDQLLNPLLRGNRLRKAFVVVFDATNQASARLVRLVDASEYAATLRDRYSWATALKEVV